MPPKAPGKRVCVLMSGGLDSAALVGHYLRLGFRVQPVYTADGLRWERAGLASTRRFLRALGSRRVDPLRVLRLEQRDLYAASHWARGGKAPSERAPWESVRLEGRNLLLLAKAGTLCGMLRIPRVSLAIMRGNPFPDARAGFLRAMGRALSLAAGRPVRVEAPFSRLNKEQVIRRHRDLPLRLTLSCLAAAGSGHCGTCTKCFERRRAFARAGVPDLASYRRNSRARTLPSNSQVRK